ncbi:MAG: hypothetical protein JHC93_08340, partial [Parachlamydiales bacterium]|nr:hypothetical protein [Parachlamydiales bacterium]
MSEIKGFSFEASSDCDYEKMVIFINYNFDQVATITSEEGTNVVIELLSKDQNKVIWTFDCEEFIQIIS